MGRGNGPDPCNLSSTKNLELGEVQVQWVDVTVVLDWADF